MPERRGSNASEGASTTRSPRWRDRARVVVHDASMRPALEPGDRLKVDRAAYRLRSPSVGEVVVLVDPEDPARWLVKRVAAVDRDGRTVDVRGDATEVARDSRRFGPVPFDLLVGRAYRLYYPPARRRDL
jgi:nickel-type superoxide dismutase maturation protease